MSEEKQRDSMKCIEIAKAAISIENLAKAKRLLLKAERLYPSDTAKELLEQIEKNPYNQDNKKDSQESEYIDTTDIITAEKCLTIARIAIAGKDVAKAERFLIKSVKFYALDEAKKLLENIKLHGTEEDAEKFIQEAKDAYLEGKYDKSIEILSKAEHSALSDHKLDIVKELISKIREAKNEELNNDLTVLKNGVKIKVDVKLLSLWDRLANAERPSGTLAEAEKCIESAQLAFNSQNSKKALRLLLKAERLYPTNRAKDLLGQVQEKILERGEDPKVVIEAAQRVVVVVRKPVPPPPPPKKREITSAQISEIERVKNANGSYEVLGIPSGSQLQAVRKAYKYLTKMLHPDKNWAPGAKEAFMKAKEAADTLQAKLKK